MARSKKSAGKGSKGKKSRKGKVKVDFEGVESGGRSIEDGWARLRVKSAELTEAESSGNEMFAIQFEATRGKEKAIVFDNLVLTPNALWKLRTFMEACGVEVPDGEMTVSEEDLIDLECEGEINNEEYEDKIRPRVTAFRPLDSDEDEEEEDEEEEESEDDEDSEDEEEEDESEDDDDSDDEDEDDSDDEEDEDEDEDEDEEEDEKPSKKSKKSKKSKPKKGKKPKLRAGMKVSFEDNKGKTKKGVITSIDDDTVFVEDSKDEEWELSTDEITLV